MSTESADPRQRVDPLPFTGAPHAALARLRAVVVSVRGSRVTAEGDGYLRAEFTTRLLRFVDDAEFHVDAEAGVIRFRSASRVGRNDLGVNRRRMTAVARGFAAAP